MATINLPQVPFTLQGNTTGQKPMLIWLMLIAWTFI
ncbi:hypothetical protein SMSRO_SF029720 [Spiroplasma poulsonii]|uniref:Uncharacterized protein n=1 Tax=Spiroplasma poulsonii TaxID=2138 RepID=A0A2P6F8Q3_9MOLU|nr:hypothetical protein SMSRO_SF029720 [Spiroplasma poulsonii]